MKTDLTGSRPTSSPARARPGLARILVTDDQPEMLRLVDRALGRQYRCEFAGTVAQAHEKLASISFQLALCDLQMLGGSGLALAEEITEEHPETAVVLVTEGTTRRSPGKHSPSAATASTATWSSRSGPDSC